MDSEILRIMQDNRLTIEAKAIYIYFLQLSCGENKFKLKRSKEIQADLQIGSFAYHSHLRRLIDNGYVEMFILRDKQKRFDGIECHIVKVNK